MIYSISMFFNEFDLLDLKISEELDEIDNLIIIESYKTHSNKSKKLLLRNNIKYNNKKIKILECGDEFTENAYLNEKIQRDQFMKENFNDEDIIISCDMDEILNKKDIKNIVEKTKELNYVRLVMDLYYYKINLKFGHWRSPIATTGKFLRESKKTLSELRHIRQGIPIQTMGKHFSYLSDSEGIKNKLESFKHTELKRFAKKEWIEEKLRNKEELFGNHRKGTVEKIDETYPKSILENLKFWEKYIINE